MDENNNNLSPAPAPGEDRDQELFQAIGKNKKRKKIRRWVITLTVLALVAGGITAGVILGRRKVRQEFGNYQANASSVVAYVVDNGSVTTTVNGSGLLRDVDTEKLSLPEGVTLNELLVEAGDRVEQGQALATVEVSSVLGALSDTQSKIDELDKKLRDASGQTVADNINTQVAGRIKKIYAQVGDDVAACMVEHGALALLSLDGYMAVDLETDALQEGDAVTVVRANGQEIKGTVERVSGGVATVLVSDNGPELDESVTVRHGDGDEVGSGALYIHNPLRITGYAGTIARHYAAENLYMYANTSVFLLRDTAYTANYESILKERRELEEKLLVLLDVYRSGTYNAPFAGTVSSIDYKKDNGASSGNDGGQSPAAGMSTYSSYGDAYSAYVSGQTGATGGNDAGSENTASSETALLTLARDEKMSVTITVDETDILSLEVGQSAQVTINSIGDMFLGEVTEINRDATSEAGVTSYSAVITVPKDPRMMSGMSAKAVVRIQGVAGAILIPSDAVHQTRDAAFVYTEYNYDTKEFGGAVPVITGLSDGSMTEIVEGLEQGDTVYYTEVFDPYSYYNESSDGDAWVETYYYDAASAGDVWIDASDGDAWTDASDGDASVG
ncbi:MAG: HlyD family efflux transporter periplasmic adaptor subunit [Oscillospiraceae bacterium]|nr:HlyD family efflux transporter periplasmic adaptor subunit [Oscillospiraceae bacterium]